MKYFYRGARYPEDVALLAEINQAAERLHKKLVALDLKQIGISEYNQRYLGDKLKNPIGILQLYTHLLALSLAGNRAPLEEFVFVDYGGGSGVLSLLAKELGIGRVIYNDIYDVSCEDIGIVSRETGIAVDDRVCGDIEALIDHLQAGAISISAISSYDVIEHIYDIDAYLKKLPLLSSGPFRAVFASAANGGNPMIASKLKAGHLEVECNEREKKWGHKDRDSLESYLGIRKAIICEYDDTLSTEEVERIATLTRGLMKHDIEKCLNELKATGQISYRPDHPTNTCDPHTGNWAEHLMDTGRLKSTLQTQGFQVKILGGCYSDSGGTAAYKRVIKRCLNIGISTFGKNALCVSPYYIVYADRVLS